MRFHAVPGMSLYINYAGFLEVHKNAHILQKVSKISFL